MKGAEEVEFYHLKIVLKTGKEIEMRSTRLEPLKNLAEQIKDAAQQLENLGLPLTIEPHEKGRESLLSGEGSEEISLRGMVNLLILLLLCYHVKNIIVSLDEHDFVLQQVATDFWNSGMLFDYHNYLTSLTIVSLSGFCITSYIIEKIGPKYNLSEPLVSPP